MGKMVRLFLVAVLAFLAGLVACSGGSGAPTATIVPPVQAQSGYSNADVTGNYNFELAGASVQLNGAAAGSGTLVANGSGQFTSGTYSIAVPGYLMCSGSLSGTYSIPNSGLGTATLSATPDSTSIANGCQSATLKFSLAPSVNANTIAFSENDTVEVAAGVALK